MIVSDTQIKGDAWISAHSSASAVQHQCAIAVKAKASQPGRVKTRLVPPLNPTHAAELNTAFTRDFVHNIGKAAELSPISTWLAFAPKGTVGFLKNLALTDVNLLETVANAFGECLLQAISSLLDKGFQSACVVNADSPTSLQAYLVAAATVLSGNYDCDVIGPSTDGGYYLLGLKRPHSELFETISWSTELVFVQTMQRAANLGLPMVVLPTWYDVDDAASLSVLHAEMDTGCVPFIPVRGRGSYAPATRRLLASQQHLEQMLADASREGAVE
jgi:uncharacterized protein